MVIMDPVMILASPYLILAAVGLIIAFLVGVWVGVGIGMAVETGREDETERAIADCTAITRDYHQILDVAAPFQCGGDLGDLLLPGDHIVIRGLELGIAALREARRGGDSRNAEPVDRVVRFKERMEQHPDWPR